MILYNFVLSGRTNQSPAFRTIFQCENDSKVAKIDEIGAFGRLENGGRHTAAAEGIVS